MAGHGHGAFPPTPGRIYTFGAKAMGAVMWFWILYRAKEDGPALLVGEGGRTKPGDALMGNGGLRCARQTGFPRLTLLPLRALFAVFAGLPAPVGASRPRAPGERQVALRALSHLPCAGTETNLHCVQVGATLYSIVEARSICSGHRLGSRRERVLRVAALDQLDVVGLGVSRDETLPEEKVDEHQAAVGLERARAHVRHGLHAPTLSFTRTV